VVVLGVAFWLVAVVLAVDPETAASVICAPVMLVRLRSGR
jgi:hypothetical protein